MLFADIRHALRMMRRAPLFTAAVILTVMLAIGANTTIFSVVNAVLLRPLPFKQPSRLVQVAEKNDKLNLPTFSSSILNFVSWREQSQSFQELGAIGFNNYTLTGTGEPEQLSGNRISPALTRVLGISALIGRTFSDAEEKPGAPAVAMIGEGLWKRRFGGDRGLVGRTVILDGAPTTVVGVAPAALNLFSGADIYTPLTIDRAKELRLNHLTLVIGRLKDGVSIEQAQAEMNIVDGSPAPEALLPAIREKVHELDSELALANVRTMEQWLSNSAAQRRLNTVMLSVFAFVALLIASVGIYGVLAYSVSQRTGEIGVRMALGATPRDAWHLIIREGMIVVLIGIGAGLLGGLALSRAVSSLVFGVPVRDPVIFIGVAATLATVAFAACVIPALRASRVDPIVALRYE